MGVQGHRVFQACTTTPFILQGKDVFSMRTQLRFSRLRKDQNENENEMENETNLRSESSQLKMKWKTDPPTCFALNRTSSSDYPRRSHHHHHQLASPPVASLVAGRLASSKDFKRRRNGNQTIFIIRSIFMIAWAFCKRRLLYSSENTSGRS